MSDKGSEGQHCYGTADELKVAESTQAIGKDLVARALLE